MITRAQIFWRYVIFCVLAILANLGSQALAHEWMKAPDWFSIGLGTGVGLVLKYILDRNYIFYVRETTLNKDFRRFCLYTLFGLFTTILFWSIEWLFIQLFTHPLSRYIGGAIGLILGYFIKYLMDREWVFKPQKN